MLLNKLVSAIMSSSQDQKKKFPTVEELGHNLKNKEKNEWFRQGVTFPHASGADIISLVFGTLWALKQSFCLAQLVVEHY